METEKVKYVPTLSRCHEMTHKLNVLIKYFGLKYDIQLTFMIVLDPTWMIMKTPLVTQHHSHLTC